MAFSAELLLASETTDRLSAHEFHWGIVQLTDDKNVPQNGILVGHIRVVLDRLYHPVLAAWMADSYKTLNGQIVVQRADGMGVMRTIEFEDAHCFNQGMRFDGTGSTFASGMSVLISARTLRIDGALVLSNGEATQ